MRKLIQIIIAALILSSFIACDFSEDTKKSSGNSTTVQTPEGEKTYTIDPLPEADFYFFTESGKFYKYVSTTGELTQFSMTVTISQDGHSDITQNIIPIEFFKLGLIYNFEFEIDGITILMNQVGNDIEVVDELWRHPDKMHIEMNNSRFSITTNTYDIYTVSDIQNITLSTGIARTLLCSNYYLGKYHIYDYGLFFVAEDDGLSTITNGLWYWSENDGSYYKEINEKGEMW